VVDEAKHLSDRGLRCYNRRMGEGLPAEIERAAAVFKHFGAREVYLFGSTASGGARPDSDVDMAVSGLPPRLFFHAMGEVSQLLGRPLDLIDLDDDTPFARYLKKKGLLVRVS